MAIPKGHKKTLDMIIRAAKADDLCILECRDKATGQACSVLCAVNSDGEEFEMVPLSRLFDGNPYDLLDPPNPDGGFVNTSPATA